MPCSVYVSTIPIGCLNTGRPPRLSLCECSLQAALPANLIYSRLWLPAGYWSPLLLSLYDQSQLHFTSRGLGTKEKLCSHGGCIYYYSRMLLLLLLALFWLSHSVIILVSLPVWLSQPFSLFTLNSYRRCVLTSSAPLLKVPLVWKNVLSLYNERYVFKLIIQYDQYSNSELLLVMS